MTTCLSLRRDSQAYWSASAVALDSRHDDLPVGLQRCIDMLECITPALHKSEDEGFVAEQCR